MEAKGGSLVDEDKKGVLEEGNREKKKGSPAGGQEPATQPESGNRFFANVGVLGSTEEQEDAMRRAASISTKQAKVDKAIHDKTGVNITTEDTDNATTSLTGSTTKNTFYQG